MRSRNSRTRIRVWMVVCVSFVAGALVAPLQWDRAQAQLPRNPNSRIADLEDAVALLTDDLNALESTVELLTDNLSAVEAKLANVNVDGNDVIFEGVNVIIRNGAGSTDTTNGVGNLIVGYDADYADDKTGSHNLIVGDRHSYPSFAGLVAGFDNTISAGYSSVSGGIGNVASGEASSVSGGNSNEASGFYASVSGGVLNVASQIFATVSGGAENEAAGTSSTVSGGVLIFTNVGNDHQP